MSAGDGDSQRCAGRPAAPRALGIATITVLVTAYTAYLVYALLWKPPQPPLPEPGGEWIVPRVHDAPVITAPVLDLEAEAEVLELPVEGLEPPVRDTP